MFESSKLEVVHYIDVNDEPNTIKAIDKLINDFNRPERQAFVYDIAKRIDELHKNEPNRWTETLLNKVIAIDPNGVFAKRAKANLIRLGIVGAIKTEGDINDIVAGVERIANDFNKMPETERDLAIISNKLSGKGWEGQNAKNQEKAVRNWQLTVWVREQVIDKYPNSPTRVSAYYFAAVVIAQNLREYEKGIEYFRKVVENWPEYSLAWNAQGQIGFYLERIKARDKIKDAKYDLQIIDAYKKVFEKYPESSGANFSMLKVANLYYGISQFADAAIYYEKYLGKKPDELKNVILNYGDCLEKSGRKDDAKVLYEDYIKFADTYDKAIPTIKDRLAKLGGIIQ